MRLINGDFDLVNGFTVNIFLRFLLSYIYIYLIRYIYIYIYYMYLYNDELCIFVICKYIYKFCS